jgi:hypothetical protein
MTGTRKFPRYTCPGGVEIHVPDTNRRLWGRLGDICREGLYMEAPEPWPTGTAIAVRLEIEDTYIEGGGTIVTCHPGVGMGIALQVKPEYVEEIEHVLAGLAANAGSSGSTVPYR